MGDAGATPPRHLSPFRYPGGKSWLAPAVASWLAALGQPTLLLEPFAGGASVGLYAVAGGHAGHVHLVERDDDVAAVWQILLQGSEIDVDRLSALVADFAPERAAVESVVMGEPDDVVARAFRTIVRNRCQRNGIMAPGAGLMASGERGHGLASRWYPGTLVARFRAVRGLANRITFTHGDALDAIESTGADAMFVDPPYTAGNGKRAGGRLYAHHHIDHDGLLTAIDSSGIPALVTYDDDPWVRDAAARHGFSVDEVPMRSGHNVASHELVLDTTRRFAAASTRGRSAPTMTTSDTAVTSAPGTYSSEPSARVEATRASGHTARTRADARGLPAGTSTP